MLRRCVGGSKVSPIAKAVLTLGLSALYLLLQFLLLQSCPPASLRHRVDTESFSW